MEGGAKFFKSFVAAEMWVNVEIIEAVIFMDGGGGENRVQIKGVYAEFFKIGDFFGYSFKVAAVKIEAAGFFVFFGNRVPIFDFY